MKMPRLRQLLQTLKKAFAAVCAAALLAGPSSAATYNITGTGDSGAGTFRQAVLDSNGAGGSNILAWGAGSGGTITLLSSLDAVAANTTLDASAAPAAATVAGWPYGFALGGATTFKNTNAGQDWTITALISGEGSMAKTGAGALVLSGINTYSGGTTVSAGTLSIDSDLVLGYGSLTLEGGGTLKTAASVVTNREVILGAGGGIVDSAGMDSAFYYTVSGTGSLTKKGTGILYLRAANTYSGGTVLDAGTIDIISDASLGSASGILTFNGGTLRSSRGLTSARNMTINGGGATFDAYSKTLELSGVLSGAGGLTKTGEGTLLLTGTNNTYAGGTTVSAGVLQIGANNALPANKALTVSAAGTFEMGAYTQSVSNAVIGGNLFLTLQPSVTNLAASGTVTLNDATRTGTLVVRLAPQVVASGQTFKPITAAGGLTGTFASITGPAALTFTPTYNANDVTLTASLVPLRTLGADSNQAAVGSGLEALRTSASGDAAAVVGELNTLDLPSMRAALDRVGPVALASMAGVSMGASGVHAGALSQRMAALASLGRGQRAVASSPQRPASPFPGILVAEAGLADSGEEPLEEERVADSWGFFGSGIYRDGRLREAGTPSGTQPGYAFNSAGFTAGADRLIRDGLAVGLAAGYLRGHASIYAPSEGVVE
ncbi:MAG: autotransporter-associated beta strand repeat-containing protein, partial [Elusimicrobiota bacterium]